ncbi:MAG: isochorismatase family cysteine hydrolase [Pseudomonadota bacterium]
MKQLDLTKSALIVIDMQRYFLEEGADAYLDPPKSLLPNVIKLIEAFRKMYRPIVFSRHAHKRTDPPGQMSKWWDNKLPWDDEEQSKLVDEIKPAAGEIFITKTRYSLFEGNELDARLKGDGINTTVICGVMTNLCVETTARHAFMKDLQPVVVEDACASNSAEFHNAAITNLKYGFAFIEKTESVLTLLQSRGK